MSTSTLETSRRVPRIGLNRAEVATSIGVCANTVDLMVKEGCLPPPRRWHSRKVWLISEIEAALQAWPEDGDIRDRGKDAGHDEWRAS